ncbi:MAG: NTP transferase domain-containing protein, partial [Opitutaceae bacterium]
MSEQIAGDRSQETRVRNNSLLTPAAGLPAFRFGAVILAAGASTRMGTPKQLLPIDGQPLLVRAVAAALASSAWPV